MATFFWLVLYRIKALKATGTSLEATNEEEAFLEYGIEVELQGT